MVSSVLNLSPSSPRLNSKAQPPRSKPSDPPGSSKTPSTVTNSVTTRLPISPPLRLPTTTGRWLETNRPGCNPGGHGRGYCPHERPARSRRRRPEDHRREPLHGGRDRRSERPAVAL